MCLVNSMKNAKFWKKDDEQINLVNKIFNISIWIFVFHSFILQAFSTVSKNRLNVLSLNIKYQYAIIKYNEKKNHNVIAYNLILGC